MKDEAEGFVSPIGKDKDAAFGKEEEGGTQDVGEDAEEESAGNEKEEFLPFEIGEGCEGTGEVASEPEHADSRAGRVDADFGILKKEKSAFTGHRKTAEGKKSFGAGGNGQSNGPGEVEIEGGHQGKRKDEESGKTRMANEPAGEGDGEKGKSGGEQRW